MNIRFTRLHAGEKLITFLQCPPIKIKEPPVEEKKSKTVGKAMGAHTETLLSYNLLDKPQMTPIKKRQQQEEG